MLGSLTSFQMKENVNFVVKMAMVSKLKGKRYWRNDRQISEDGLCQKGSQEGRKEGRGGKEGKEMSLLQQHCGFFFWLLLLTKTQY